MAKPEFTCTVAVRPLPEQSQPEAGVHAFQNRVSSEGRRNKNGGSRRAGFPDRFRDRIEDGNFLFERLPALARRNAGDNLCAVIEAQLCVPRAKAAGDALDENLCFGFSEDGHEEDLRF